MRKKDNLFGRYIEGVTDIHKREWLEKYIDWKSWTSADNWLHTELCYLHKKILRGRVIYYTFGTLISVVMAFFTWVVFFQKADEKELAVFPLATYCNNLYIKLCQIVPGGEPAVITGLLFIPFFISAIIAVVFCFVTPKKFAAKIKRRGENCTPSEVRDKLILLEREHYKYSTDFFSSALIFTLFTGLLTGGVMVFSSVPGGLNPFEYIFLGIICDVAYGVCLFGIAAVYGWLQEKIGVDNYFFYELIKKVEWEMGIRPSDNDCDTTPDPFPVLTDSEITGIVIDTEDDLTGMGFGDY